MESKQKYLVWFDEHETEEEGVFFSASDVGGAARQRAKYEYYGDDFDPDYEYDAVFCVRCPSGAVEKVRVTASFDPIFYATILKSENNNETN